VYSGKLTPTKHPLHFLSVVSLFPHLVAGPIVRVKHILPQMEALNPPSQAQAWEGLQLISLGLFKKMVLADNLAPFVNSVYDGSTASGSSYFVATIAFAFQIYYDFSGYTDCAIGLAKWIGIEFEPNFRHPYSAIGFSDFWSRWHISLSSWVRDYIFIPLGGSRVSEIKVHRNIWAAMLLSGLWHGANWTFMFWGGVHACFQSLERITKWPSYLLKSAFGRFVGVVVTFAMACFGWIFFRAQTIHQAFSVVRQCLHFTSGLSATMAHFRGPMLFAFGFGILMEAVTALRVVVGATRPIRTPELVRMAACSAMLLMCLLISGPGKAFIYFQF
jgi:D-alanyl-lipoteichoic acid acyltransferase DltB (MBOAT superfamily)